MTPKEIDAFSTAYNVCVGDVDAETVADFMRRYNAGENVPYFRGYNSLLDALMMWNSAVKFQLNNQ